MKFTIFYIDDEPMLCENFQDEFESDDILVKTFLDPNRAIDEAQRNPPDLVFIDFRFPKITGEQVAASLPAAIPKILVTGDLNIKASANFQSVLTKPVLSDDIVKIIQGIRSKAS